MVVLFFAMVGLVFPVDRIASSVFAELPGRPPERLSKGAKNFWTGEWADNAHRVLRNESSVTRRSVGPYNELVFRLTGRLQPAVRLGRDKWLSPAERPREIPPLRVSSLIRENVRLILRIDKILEAHRARLVVGLVPDRSRIYPDRAYLSGKMPPQKRVFLPRLTRALTDAGIIAVDLTEALRKERASGTKVFFSDDHHWTYRGAAASARPLADAWTPEWHEGRRMQFSVRWTGSRPSKGSLLRILGFRRGSAAEAAFRDRAAVAELGKGSRRDAFCAAYWSTSFGQFHSGEFYASAVGCPVDIVRRSGQGSSCGPRLGLPAILRRRERDSEIVVVWEIPEYHMVNRTAAPPAYISATDKALVELGLSEGRTGDGL